MVLNLFSIANNIMVFTFFPLKTILAPITLQKNKLDNIKTDKMVNRACFKITQVTSKQPGYYKTT